MTRRMLVFPALAAALVLLPALSAPAWAGAEKSANKNIVQTARKAGSFQTLLQAVQAAGLTKTLQKDGPFTVFAPTDEAFAKLGAETIQSLLADPARLKSILLYHVVEGAVPASQVVGLSTATTVNGASVSIAVVDGAVILNGGSRVVTTDVQASNGVIHVIDTVLLPPSN